MDGNCHTDFFAEGIIQTETETFLSAYKSVGCPEIPEIDPNYDPCEFTYEVISLQMKP